MPKSTKKSGSGSTSKKAASQAKSKQSLNKMKQDAANTVGVTLNQDGNGHLTSREAGSIGGQMVKKMCPVRTMKFDRKYRWLDGHSKTFTYEIRMIA